jgi:hypothetical protein
MVQEEIPFESLRSVVSDWGVEDWLQAQALAPLLEATIRTTCNLHRGTPVFDKLGLPTAPVRKRLFDLSPRRMVLAMAPVIDSLNSQLQAFEAEDEGIALERLSTQKGVGPGLARLAGCRLELPGGLTLTSSHAKTHADDSVVVAESPNGDTPAEGSTRAATAPLQGEVAGSAFSTEGTGDSSLPDSPDRAFADALDRLSQQQGLDIEATARLSSAAAAGGAFDVEDLRTLGEWNAMLESVCEQAGLEPEGQTVAGLDAELARRARASKDAATQRTESVLLSLLGAQPSAGAEAALRPILQAVDTMSVKDMDERAVRAYTALHGLLSMPAWQVDDQDASAVEEFFGRRVMLVAASEVIEFPSLDDVSSMDQVDESAPHDQHLTPSADSATPTHTANVEQSDVRDSSEDDVQHSPTAPRIESKVAAEDADRAPSRDNLKFPVKDEPVAEEGEFGRHKVEEGSSPAADRLSPDPSHNGEGASREPARNRSAAQTPERTAAPNRSPEPAPPGAEIDTDALAQETNLVGADVDTRIATSLQRGNPGLAYWYSQTLGSAPETQAILEVLALSDAITTDGDPCAMRVRDLLQDYDATAISINPVLVKIAAGTAARIALRLPFSPATPLLADACDLLGDESPSFLRVVREAAEHGVELKSVLEQGESSQPQLVETREEALAALREQFEVASQRHPRTYRAINIWRHLLTAKGTLGAVMSVTFDSPNHLEPARVVLAELSDLKHIDKLIDETDSQLHPMAAPKSKIISRARADLRELVSTILAPLARYVEASEAVALRPRKGSSTDNTELVELLRREVSKVDSAQEGDPGDYVLDQSRTWICDVLRRRIRLASLALQPWEALGRALTYSFEVTRLADGSIKPGSVTTEALDSLEGRDGETAYQGMADEDDHLSIERLIEAVREDGDAALAERLAERQKEDLRVSRERLTRLIETTDRELSLALSTALLSESESTALLADVERVRADPDVDFVSARQELRAIIATVSGARQKALGSAREQLSVLTAPDPIKQRIEELLDAGDLINAQEFLAQLAAGAQELPEEAHADATLSQFWPGFSTALEHAGLAVAGVGEVDWFEDLVASHRQIDGFTVAPPDASPKIQQGLDGWFSLTRSAGQGEYRKHLIAVLAMLGLELTGVISEQGKSPRLRLWTSFPANRVGQALVPVYGSASKDHYQVLLCWDRQSVDAILSLVDGSPGTSPVIVLYFQTLSVRERHALAEASRPHSHNVSAVVVDHATIAFLGTRREAALHTALGISLPFTAINPYTPFVLGDVPREVFYGRKVELARVQDPNDALFVYGGRQLGKSALLKTAQREFQERDPRWRSVYVDLKAQGIGEWRPADEIWSVLVPQLRDAGIVDTKVTTRTTPEGIVTGIRKWLDEDKHRRFLLLLDEADAFLETDARARVGSVGVARFVNVYRLKGLMDGTERRFKPVFAGLHQVQRFHSTSNGPMAHVGAEIPVGPLPPAEAYKLVVKPLAAVGYLFETPDAVWRLLNYTNYQASLIQLFCDALLKRLHQRKLGAAAPPTRITGQMVDEVYSDKDLRSQIATRFEWTINLDNRYRVIAYAAAWLSLNGEPQFFAPVTLYDECSTFWQAGYEQLALDEFVAYLDEMAGLGVLVCTPDGEYGIRSPNVVRLLGSPEEIERRLEESDKLELSSPFDPARYRRALRGQPNLRSPLSEAQAKHVLDAGEVMHLVVGTEALGLGRVTEALTEATADGIAVHPATPKTLQATMTELSRQKSRRHIVLDTRNSDPSDALEAVSRLARQVSVLKLLSGSCLLTPSLRQVLESAAVLPDSDIIELKPWGEDSLQAWAPECSYPLASHKERQDLLDVTGGWPDLVESIVTAVSDGVPPPRAREEASESILNAEARAAFLANVGLIGEEELRVAQTAASWSEAVTFSDLLELLGADEHQLITVLNTLVGLAVLRRSASGDTYRINSLIAELLLLDS